MTLKIKMAYRNNLIKPPGGGGGLFKTRPSREGAYSRGGLIQEGVLIQKEAFLRGDLFETHYVLKEAECSPKKLSKS